MILCLDVGNTHIFGGVFSGDKVILRFRHNSSGSSTSDQIGVFLKTVLKENNLAPNKIKAIGFCSVVPSIDYSLRAACKKYFEMEPFILQMGVKTGIKIKTQNPNESGADLIAGAVAATYLYPNKNIIIIDFGTVTTLSAISKNKEFQGASFIPGMHTAMNSLQLSAAKLIPVEILNPQKAIGRTTSQSIQSGLYYGHLGAIKEIVSRIIQETFIDDLPLLIGTGGFSHLFEKEKILNHIEPDLILQGIRLAMQLNS